MAHVHNWCDKIIISILFIVSCFSKYVSMLDFAVFYGAAIMSLIMIGAILMHLKVNDPFKKSIPAIAMLAFYSIIFLNYIL